MSSGDSCDYAPTMWAQRKDLLLITFKVQDCKNADVKFEEKKIIFHGQGGTLNKKYNATLELLKEIVPEECKWEQTSRSIFIHAKKKESGPFWPRLLDQKVKQHWLKVDFDKMKDEDESSDEEMNMGGPGAQPDLSELMSQMGRGTGNTDDFGDLDGEDSDDEPDSDDEEVPDLEAAPGNESESKPTENGAKEEPAQVKA